ncbi:MAG: acetyl-CoA carboxylase biotin carboxyl carrier protein [Cyanobacteria bacterium RM1_2_2]|nr:acetyl-CoA carboxylase biotin carboxyl carrier protein [Cyanobacteria bacterium RM1_2_2]
MELDFNELRELLTVINQTDIAEFTLRSGDFELVLRKGHSANGDPSPPVETNSGAGVAPPTAPPPALPSATTPAIVTSSPTIPVASPRMADRLVDIISPMVGTFYRSPAPDEAPFVETGERIRIGQTVCIIEAMKLMNEIEAEVAGEIVEILVPNGQPVEYGQVLMRVNPA